MEVKVVSSNPTKELPTAPESMLSSDGFPCLGTYRGTVREVDLRGLRGSYQVPLLWRPFKHKRWQYISVTTSELIAAFAIADLTYTANAFAVVVHLGER